MMRALAKMLVATSRDAGFTTLFTRPNGTSAYGCLFIDCCLVVYTLEFSPEALTRLPDIPIGDVLAVINVMGYREQRADIFHTEKHRNFRCLCSLGSVNYYTSESEMLPVRYILGTMLVSSAHAVTVGMGN